MSLVFVSLFVPSIALSNFGAQFCGRYATSPHCANQAAPTCSFCHEGPANAQNMNGYGASLQSLLGPNSTIELALTNAEMIDSDGDGVLNLQEIECGTLPGDASSACSPPPPPPPPAFDYRDLSFDFAYRPKVRSHEPEIRSVSKPMRPEQLQRVFENSFGYSMQLCDSGEHCDNGQQLLDTLNLGGQDYDQVTRRVRDVTPTMPLLMAKRATTFCQATVANPVSAFFTSLPSDLSTSSANRAAANAVYQALWSQPAPSAALDTAEALLLAAPNANAGWRAVCIYYFLTEGSLLLY